MSLNTYNHLDDLCVVSSVSSGACFSIRISLDALELLVFRSKKPGRALFGRRSDCKPLEVAYKVALLSESLITHPSRPLSLLMRKDYPRTEPAWFQGEDDRSFRLWREFVHLVSVIIFIRDVRMISLLATHEMRNPEIWISNWVIQPIICLYLEW
jgi:hypothetical protein